MDIVEIDLLHPWFLPIKRNFIIFPFHCRQVLLIEDHLLVGGFLSNIVGSLLYSLKDLEVTIVMIGFYVNRTQ